MEWRGKYFWLFGPETPIADQIKAFGDHDVICGNVDPPSFQTKSYEQCLELCRQNIEAGKDSPNGKDKKRLDAKFDEIFTQTTSCATLNNALKRIYDNKSELLLVLERPDIPLHNNNAENPIREYVKKRKIKGIGSHQDNLLKISIIQCTVGLILRQ
jgi:hypothetical protein